MFVKIFLEKKKEYLKFRERLSAGILKLDESYALVGKMKQELVELAPELERKTKVRFCVVYSLTSRVKKCISGDCVIPNGNYPLLTN